MRGLPFYVKREAFARADTRQRVAYILSAVLVITMLCVIFRFTRVFFFRAVWGVIRIVVDELVGM